MTGKEQEIKALTKLVEMNGYFAEYFKKDLDVMVDNIKKDFPIELGANFNLTREQQEQRERELKKDFHKEIIDLCDTLLCVNAETGNERAYERAVQKLGRRSVISRKRQLGLDITGEEIDYLISKLDFLK